MLPSITILGRNVPTYGLCAALGLMLFVLLFKREDKHCPGESADVELGFVYGLLGAALGAKLLMEKKPEPPVPCFCVGCCRVLLWCMLSAGRAVF